MKAPTDYQSIQPSMARRAFLQRVLSLAAAYPLVQRIAKANEAVTRSGTAEAEIVALPVKYAGSGATLQGYLARPAGTGSFPAIIIEDGFAPDANLPEVARAYARAGFVALVPDPLSRRGGAASFPSVEKAREALAESNPAQRSADFRSARAFLQSHFLVRPDQIRLARG